MAVHRQHSAQGPSSWRPGTDQLLSTTISPLSQPSEESPHKKLKLTTSTPTTSPETQEPPHSMTQTDISMTGTAPPTSNHPQEDASTRTHRINSDLVKLFNRPASNRTTSISKSSRPASIKGIGLYTHIEGPKPTPRFPHERYILTAGPPAFLPLKDAARGRGRTREPGAEDKIFPWDEKVQKVWEEMRHVILEEEKKQSKRGDASRDPRKIYAALGVPKVPLPSSQTQDKNQIPIQTEDAKFQRKGSLASVQSQQERRRSSTGVVATDTQSRRASLQSPADDTPRSATVANMYDAARDPRRRGR